jgi:hypothetical protein
MLNNIHSAYYLLKKHKISAARPYNTNRIFYGINSVTCEPLLLILLPLALSAFTHIWNPTGFPYFHGDEGHYIRRAMHVLEGFGPQEQRNTTWSFEQPYDHPYFGQIFLAAGLGTINYPELVHAEPGDVSSIETLHLAPRLIMGGLAVIDTFLIYKIAERKYGRNIAFISAILFAAMPMSWLLRRVLLDSILLPFLLLSILFAVRHKYKNSSPTNKLTQIDNKEKLLENTDLLLTVLLSGIFLGLAIFTKISAFTFVPLVFYLICSRPMKINKNRKIILLGLWLLPVILIPSIWPGYAMLHEQFDEWIHGLSWQVTRSPISMWGLLDLFRIDPVLFLVGIAGIIYAGIARRDIFIIFWIIPFLIFFYVVGHVRFPYFIPIIPILCIAAAQMIVDLSSKISNQMARKLLSFGTLALIGAVGLSISILLISTNVNSTFFEIYALVTENLPNSPVNNSNNEAENDRGITIMGSNWMQTFSWIPQYVFEKDHTFKTFLRERNFPIQDGEKVILLVDNIDLDRLILSENSTKNFKQKELYNDTRILAIFNKKPLHYNFLFSNFGLEHPNLQKVEVRTNY